MDRPSRRPPLPHYRRTELSTPGHDLRMLEKASATSADLVLMDLEDGCAPSQKAGAREVVVQAAKTLDWSSKALALRPNGLDTPLFFDDLLEVVGQAGEFLDVIILPKVRSAEEVGYVDRLLTHLEWKFGLQEGRLGLEVLVETPRALEEVERIARSSPRLQALLFGLYDYAGEIGASVGTDVFSDFLYARQRIVAAAKSAGLLALDGITTRFKDLDLTRSEADRARSMGFDGKWVIHPMQIDVVHQVFTPQRSELEKAAERLRAYRDAGRSGRGAIVLGEEMVDEATLRTDLRRVELGKRLGLLPPEG